MSCINTFGFNNKFKQTCLLPINGLEFFFLSTNNVAIKKHSLLRNILNFNKKLDFFKKSY